MMTRIINRLRGARGPQPDSRELVLQCRAAAQMNRSLQRIANLAEVEFRGFSQWGEDGVVDWLLSRLPQVPESFVEFGVGNYREANTRLLLHLRNWRGLVLDGSAAHVNDILAQEVSWQFDLTAKCSFIDRDNINELIASAGFAGEIGLLSVDIDGNDYWVWQAIDCVSPAIAICEYNAVFGDLHRITIPYDPAFQRSLAHHSNLYFGASLAALVDLAEGKGYRFVGTNSNGCNAFFVRSDLAPRVLESIDEVRAYPSRFREGRGIDGNLAFTRGSSRAAAIADMSVVDLASGRTRKLGDMGALCSTRWDEA